MALLALSKATGQDFDDAICSGLSWVAGANELGIDLRDWQHGIIWDSIEPKSRITNFCDQALDFMQNSHKSRDENLRVRLKPGRITSGGCSTRSRVLRRRQSPPGLRLQAQDRAGLAFRGKHFPLLKKSALRGLN